MLLAVPSVQGGFLGGVKLENPTKIDPSKFHPAKFNPIPVDKLQHVALPVTLPAQIVDPVEAARSAQEKLVGGAPLAAMDHPEQFVEGLQKGGVIKDKAREATSGAQHAQYVAAGLASRGKDVASVVKIEDVTAAGEKVANQAKKMVAGMHPEGSEGVAGALRGATSQFAATVNQTSQQFAGFLNAFGPKASAVLSQSGDALACRFSGDCDSGSSGSEASAELPLDPTNPQDWAFWGFALCLIVAAGLVCTLALRCMYATGRKGTTLLTEALIPLAESSAREPSLHMAASA